MSYLTDRTQYVQIDDLWSERINVSFGVPQGFILCPLLFNLYINDLTDVLPTEVNCHQYANDITIYSHSKPSELQSCQAEMQAALDRLSTWSSRFNLALHPKMLLSTPQMSRTHGLDGHSIHLLWKGFRASFNFPPTWYGSARKRQLEKREKLQDLKLLRNFVCTEEVEIPCPV